MKTQRESTGSRGASADFVIQAILSLSHNDMISNYNGKWGTVYNDGIIFDIFNTEADSQGAGRGDNPPHIIEINKDYIKRGSSF